ncbi:F-box/WD repeat-containing protein 7-like [Planoprotostelium fungivorum]|uniref:F-box/WD repeat-containing protein 7-like n=1 Tax=Planoprotostelium fungivorum TaxID=1890364 RepID=A0A2P6N5K7_9EUKA|nr:F-box/WD repeat-containing protein 7-like [Planoprotostelium fungivorum]
MKRRGSFEQDEDVKRRFLGHTPDQSPPRLNAMVDQLPPQRHPLLQKLLGQNLASPVIDLSDNTQQQSSGYVDLTEDTPTNDYSHHLRMALDRDDPLKRQQAKENPYVYCRYCNHQTDKPLQIPCCRHLICRSCAQQLPPEVYSCKICFKSFKKMEVETVYIQTLAVPHVWQYRVKGPCMVLEDMTFTYHTFPEDSLLSWGNRQINVCSYLPIGTSNMLEKFPDEIILKILHFLDDVGDVLNVSLVCKDLKRSARDDSLWKRFYQIRYFTDRISIRTYKKCPDRSWMYIYGHKSSIENMKWTLALPSVAPVLQGKDKSLTNSQSTPSTTNINQRDVLQSNTRVPILRRNSSDGFTITRKSTERTSIDDLAVPNVYRHGEPEFRRKRTHSGINQSRIFVKSQCLAITCMRFDSSNVVTGGGHSDNWDFEPASLLAPNNVVVYDAKYARKVKTLAGHSDTITSVLIVGERIISGSRDRTVKIWHRSGPRWSKRTAFTVDTKRAHTKAITALHALGSTLVSASKDKTMRVWDVTEVGGEAKCVFNMPSIQQALQFKDNTIVSGGKDRKLYVTDLETSQTTMTMRGHKGWISALQINFNHVMSAGGNDGSLRLFDLRTGDNVRTIKVENSLFSNGWITSLQWDENKVICGSSDRCIRLYDIVSGKCFNTLKAHSDVITAVQYDNNKLLSSSLDRTVRFWNFSGEASGEEAESSVSNGHPSCTVS